MVRYMRSGDKKYKTIGLIMEDEFTDYAKDITHSVAHSIMTRDDLRLVVVSGRQDNSTDPEDKMHLYKSVFNSIYRINSRCHFDGLLITFPNLMGGRGGGEFFGHIPKVYIASENEDELTVNYDNERGIRVYTIYFYLSTQK